MKCSVPGCQNEAPNNLGVRLRTAAKNAIFAQDTRAYLCDEHARNGMRITVLVELIPEPSVETHVYVEKGADHFRITPIKPENLPKV
jgi:hypothetical protein